MFGRRTIIIGIFFGLSFLLLMGRLWYLQVYSAEYYTQMGLRRLHRLIPIPPARGSILDRRGRILAGDTASFDLWLQLAEYRKVEGKRKLQSNIDALKVDEIYQAIIADGAQRKIKLNLIKKSLSEHSEFVDHLAAVIHRNSNESLTVEQAKEKIIESIIDIISQLSVKNSNGVLKDERSILHSFTDPRIMLKDISINTYQTIEQTQLNPYTADEFRALLARGGYKRIYPYAELMGHVTGYSGNLTADEYKSLRGYWDEDNNLVPGSWELEKSGNLFFKIAENSEEQEMIRPRLVRREGKSYYLSGGAFSNETVGRRGVEQWYNQELRGEHVWRVEKLVKPESDGPRVFINAGSRKEAINGKNLKLTIDVDFQQEVSNIVQDELAILAREPMHKRVLDEHKFPKFPATVIVMNINNGEIYAMVSTPGYDPNKIHDSVYYNKIMEDVRYPLYNRAITGVVRGASPAGSTIKPLVGIAALEEGVINRNTEFVCEGVEYIGEQEYVCMNRAHHGAIDITDALKVSCNIFFYKAGAALGGKKLAAWLSEFGLGSKTGIDLPRERVGHLPENSFTGSHWSLGENYHLSIGQGAVDITPIQLATAYATIFNGGLKVRPHLKYDPADPELNAPQGQIKLSATNVDIIKDGMWKVVQGGEYPRGTAFKYGMIEGFEYFGKTGSAQAGRKNKDTHASFAAVAPYSEPEIVVVALIPYGDHGGASCARLVKRVLKAYFHLDDFDEINTEPNIDGLDEWEDSEETSNGALG